MEIKLVISVEQYAAGIHLICQHEQHLAPPLTQIFDHIEVPIQTGQVKARPAELLRQPCGSQHMQISHAEMMKMAQTVIYTKHTVQTCTYVICNMLTSLSSIRSTSPPCSHKCLTTSKCPLAQA